MTLRLPFVLWAAPLLQAQDPDLREPLERYRTDRAALERRYSIPLSAQRIGRMKTFFTGWRASLEKIDYDKTYS